MACKSHNLRFHPSFPTSDQVTASNFWNFDTSSTERNNIYHNMSQSMDSLRRITPGSGAYLVRHSISITRSILCLLYRMKQMSWNLTPQVCSRS